MARRVITLILNRKGFAVSEATTVAEAMHGIFRQPEWVLLDIMLPDGSGLDVLKRIRAERLPVRVCVISGCHQHVLDESRARGADYAFSKPLDVEKLVAVLRPVNAA